MTIDELTRIIRDEHLSTPVLYGHGPLVMDAVVLERDGDRLRAFISDERGHVMGRTEAFFDDESAALDYVLVKLRQDKTMRDAFARLP